MFALATASLALLAASPVLAAWRAPHPEVGTFADLADALAQLIDEPAEPEAVAA